MKFVKEMKNIAKRFGNRMDTAEGSFGETLWVVCDCMGMIQSHLAYNDYDFMDSIYSKRYVEELGYETVEEIWHAMKKYFDENCYVMKGVYTDNEGLTYNSIVDRLEEV